MEERTIADSLKPTFENVTRMFITETMHDILFEEDFPNFKFDFRQEEAIDFIKKVLQEYVDKYDFYKEKVQKIYDAIEGKKQSNEIQPVMIVNDYKQFFELLREYYEKDIELYFKRIDMSFFPVYEQEKCFKEIWLRATPDDFNNPENFLRKQLQMIKDTTFEKYDKETCLGKLSFLDDNIICIKNGIARTWDENLRQMEITIYDKQYYHNTELFIRPHYTLPVIRYGIYEKDGKKVCHIGSIQNKLKSLADKEIYDKQDVSRNLERKKYKVNKDVPEEEKDKVEPKNILALSVFIDLLSKEGITYIEVPSMYVLDYEYHEKRSKNILKNFNKKWTEEKKKRSPMIYKEEEYYLQHNYEKQDLISEIKSERMIKNFERILYHYPNGKITSYPGELDSFLHLNIPPIKNKDDINGGILRDIYQLVEEKYIGKER